MYHYSFQKAKNSQKNKITISYSKSVKITSEGTGKRYFIAGNLSCDNENVIYLISCDKGEDEYRVFAEDFKPRFRMHKSNIKIEIGRCVNSRHFNEKCVCSPSSSG